MSFIVDRLRSFARDIRANIAIESLLFIPMMAWSFVAMSVIWEGYRAQNLAQRATFTLADIISRERVQIHGTQMPLNYLRVFAYAAEVTYAGNLSTSSVRSAFPGALRITNIIFSAGTGGNAAPTSSVLWSVSSHADRLPPMTNAGLGSVADKIPVLLGGDSLILVETELKWRPDYTAAMAGDLLIGRDKSDMIDSNAEVFGEQILKNAVAVRPRFVTRLCFINNSGGVITNQLCELN
jgi:Flp pilus assembly protein TadG